jgi:Recombinational DNA repair protein (RecF pathway)
MGLRVTRPASGLPVGGDLEYADEVTLGAPSRDGDCLMSEPPARAPDDGGEWRPLADQIAVNVKNFIDGVEALAQSGGDETVPLLLLEVSQILLAGAQLGASSDVILPGNWEPEVGDDPDLDALRTGLAGRLSAVDEYAEVFDPYKDTSCLPFRISDDIAAVVADLSTASSTTRPAGRSRRCGGGSTPISSTGDPRRGRTARAARRGRARQPGRRRGEHQPVTTAGQPGPFG